MARRGLSDTVVHLRAAGESGAAEELRLSQADGGVRVYNGALISLLVATCLRTDIARQSASLLGCTGALHNGSACAQRGRCVKDC